MGREKKRNNSRLRSKKVFNRKRRKSKKYKSSKWKLKYPEIFKEVDYPPYIVRRDEDEEK